ncbi:MAG: hypothetical protein OXG97_01115 [Candidatus Poribacteria bacterium]|nr:hypothetical protein [Candidatus Poribacteria bacterium]
MIQILLKVLTPVWLLAFTFLILLPTADATCLSIPRIPKLANPSP